jgi:hypothetical protein
MEPLQGPSGYNQGTPRHPGGGVFRGGGLVVVVVAVLDPPAAPARAPGDKQDPLSTPQGVQPKNT